MFYAQKYVKLPVETLASFHFNTKANFTTIVLRLTMATNHGVTQKNLVPIMETAKSHALSTEVYTHLLFIYNFD